MGTKQLNVALPADLVDLFTAEVSRQMTTKRTVLRELLTYWTKDQAAARAAKGQTT